MSDLSRNPEQTFSYDSLYCVSRIIKKHVPHHKKTCFSICKKEDVDQLPDNHETDQHLSSPYKVITIHQFRHSRSDNMQYVKKAEPGWKSNKSCFSN